MKKRRSWKRYKNYLIVKKKGKIYIEGKEGE